MASTPRIRDLPYSPGIHTPGSTNSILDVPGVHISQFTTPTTTKSNSTPANSTSSCKGLTLISPRPPQYYHNPCAASTFTFNGNGELTGTRQIHDWGFINTPIAFTNSLSLGTVFDGVWDWVLEQQDSKGWSGRDRSRNYGTPVVGETADWLVNSDLRESRLGKEDVRECFEGLRSKEGGVVVQEGQFGGGAGMTCHQFAGGTGTSSRIVGGGEGSEGEFTVGVLVQTNYGHLVDLQVGGVPVGKILKKEREAIGGGEEEQGVDVHAPEADVGRVQDGSILVLIITDAPLSSHQLNRVARHATVGLAQVGGHGVGRTFSGDIFLAVSTAEQGPQQLEGAEMRHMNPTQTYAAKVVKNESIDPYFYAASEATEEAILNSMLGGSPGVVGMDGTKVDGFPVERVRELLKKHLVSM
ncbi:hypothetical protein AC579_8641 [Pseudocercospora musae]|uniref:Peptidase S58 DmpA/arginine biosynthesis protein ArgJ n=1 Tax=Pseudocercospora musae TaxID=113226 RepID=A0A139IFG4_9PEZI|nr:hypothetical protein AC579_8641 [Pseudocercospora musae]